MKKFLAVLVALGLTSVFAADANKTEKKAEANKTEKKAKAKKEKAPAKAEANKTK